MAEIYVPLPYDKRLLFLGDDITYNEAMDTTSTPLSSLSPEELEACITELGFPKYRANQVYDWVHAKHVSSYDQMTNVPKALRDALEARFPFEKITVVDRRVSKDGTRKYILELGDGSLIETVGIPSHDADNGDLKRLTVCFSTQVGCAMACEFCATGKEGFTRNLTTDEILSQVAAVEQDFGYKVTNVVGMGQGEPFLNYDNVIAALRRLNDANEFNIGARHITVSTCGILPGIDRFSKEPEQFTLAVSLHSALQSTRDHIMPKVASMPLQDLRRTLEKYTEATNRRVTFEYLLINDVNDSKDHLQALTEYCRGLLCHVNLLAMNDIKGSPYRSTKSSTIKLWKDTLNRAGIETTVRNSRGSDIDGACGQLKNSFLEVL